jgi:hypothetical protein
MNQDLRNFAMGTFSQEYLENRVYLLTSCCMKTPSSLCSFSHRLDSARTICSEDEKNTQCALCMQFAGASVVLILCYLHNMHFLKLN